MEIRIAARDGTTDTNIMRFGELTPYTCPECHGVLSLLKEGSITRYRCHTGHAFSADSLLLSLTENIEDSLYGAIRGIEESIMLLNHIGDHFAEVNQPRLAAMYFRKAQEAETRLQLMRQCAWSHEQSSKERLRLQTEQSSKGDVGRPFEEGLAVLKQMQACQSMVDVPVIITSGNATTAFREGVCDAGYNEFLVKPIDFDRLDRLLEEYLFPIGLDTPGH